MELAVHGVDVLHFIAAMALALFFIRFGQALGAHYFPDSDANDAARYLFGGPS